MFSLKECFSYKYKERSEKIHKEYGEKLYFVEMLFAIWSQKTFSEWLQNRNQRYSKGFKFSSLYQRVPYFYNDLI